MDRRLSINKFIFYIDLEGNCCANDPEIIQIAGYLVQYCKDEPTKIHSTDVFSSIVRPIRNPPNLMAKSISGITKRDTDAAETFREVYIKLNIWLATTLAKYGHIIDTQTPYTYMDYQILFDEGNCIDFIPCSFDIHDYNILIKHVKDNNIGIIWWLSINWFDMRLVFANIKCGGNLYKLSLDSALEISECGVKRSRKVHDALEDARLCSILYNYVHEYLKQNKILKYRI